MRKKEIKPDMDLEKVVEELEAELPRSSRVAYYLYDLARDVTRFANEVMELREVEALELARLVRRALAAYMAVHAETEAGAREILANPHRLKGEVCP
jgi:hypothetical protein